MGYMIAVHKELTEYQFISVLIPYTGAIYDTKREALEEYIKAIEDPEVKYKPYIVIV